MHFSLSEIEEHADLCAEDWVDPIGQCVLNEEEQVQEEMGEPVTVVDDSDVTNATSVEAELQHIKTAVSNIQNIC